jgi:hypothetical protein
MTELIVEKYYEGLWLFSIGAVVMLILTIAIILLRNHFLKTKHGKKYGIVVMIVFLLFSISIFLYSSFELYSLSLDYDDVQQENFKTMCATLEGYVRIREGNDPNDPTLTGPIFVDDATGEEIVLKIYGYNLTVNSVGETYYIKYLPNSRIAVIIED